MRCYLTFLFLFVWLTVTAQQSRQKLSLSIPAASLEEALKLLEQESKIHFSYEYTRIKDVHVKARAYRQETLESILKDLLKDTPLSFKRKGGNILIVPRTKANNTISGFVEDAASGEKLIGVSLTAPFHRAGTATNNYGFYSLTLPGDSLRVQLSYLGYQRLDTVIALQEDQPVNFKLQTVSRQLGEVTVRATRAERIQETSQMSSINLPASMVRAMPRLLGEADLFKTLQMLPGVKQGTEATSALLVRGGTPDQNLILLDGAPLYNPMHLLGVFSTFNTSVLKDVTLYKGAFPARYGGRLSAVVDVSTKDGDMHALHGDFSIGLLSTQLTLEGPLKEGKTSFVLSGRRSYPDLIAAPFIRNMEDGAEKFKLFFHDLNAKLHHRFSDNDKLYLSLYTGKDKLRIRSRDVIEKDPAIDNYELSDLGLQWGNLTGTLRWNHVFSPRLFSNTMLIGSRYYFNTRIFTESKYREDIYTSSLKLDSGIEDYGVKTDFDYRPSPAHSIRMGAAYMFRKFTPGIVRMRQTSEDRVLMDSLNNNRDIHASETDLYVEDDWEISPRLKLNAGLHWSAFNVQGRFLHSLQPRVSLRYLLPWDWGLKASYSRMTQYIHLLANNSVSLPTDLWVPATKKIAPQQADQYAIGLSRNVFSNRFEFSAEVYYKRMHNVIEYKEGADYLTSSKGETWQDQVAAGTGESYGLEVLLQKKTGRLTGWLGYTLAKTDRHIPEVNYGRPFPYKYDRRHDIHIVSIYKLRRNIELSGSWTYQSAAPFTIPVLRYEGTRGPEDENVVPYPPGVDYIAGRNNVRIAAYHRLDLGISFIRQKKNGNIRTWNISILNAYNKLNPFFYYVNRYPEHTTQTGLTGTAILPFLPGFSYSLKF